MVETGRILLIYAVPPRLQNPMSGMAAPYGLSWIVKSLKLKKYATRVCDLSLVKAQNNMQELLQQEINEFQPSAVGISVRNINNSMNPPVSYFNFIEKVLRITKELTDVPLILGGSGFSLYPERFMAGSLADFGIIGEGEETLPFLLDAISSSKKNIKIPGVITPNGRYFPDTKNSRSGRFPIEGLPEHTAINYQTYNARGAPYPIQSKRGCSSQCIYCVYPVLEGRSYRMRNPSTVVDEIEMAAELYGFQRFFFVDSVFNFPLVHCEQVLLELVRRKINVTYKAYINPRAITDRLIELFKNSGCAGLEVTIDTAAPDTLKTYRKDFQTEDIIRTNQSFKQFNIPTYYWVNLGGPGETPETLRKNLDILDCLTEVTIGYIGVGLVVFPRTPLMNIAVATGQLKSENDVEFPVFLSKHMSGDFAREIQLFCIEHPHWWSPYDMFHREHRKMVQSILHENITDYWSMQKQYGNIRQSKFKKSQWPILSHEDFIKWYKNGITRYL